MDIKQTVARRIRMARAERGVNQAELGDLLQVNQKLVSRLESERVNIGVETLERIAHALQKPITYFFEPVEDVKLNLAPNKKEVSHPDPKARTARQGKQQDADE